MNINIVKVPFSCPGSYLAIQKDEAILGDGIWLRSLIRPEWGTGRKKVSDHILRFIPTDSQGTFINYQTICTPECLRFESNFGFVEIYFSHLSSIHIRTKNMGLVLEHDADESKWVNIEVGTDYARGYLPITFFDIKFSLRKGSLRYRPDLRRFFITCEENADFVISAWQRFVQKEPEGELFEKKQIRENFQRFRDAYQPSGETHELATYILWSGEYARCGHLTRNATAVSKKLMNNVWSWDNCFNALALALSNKTLARDNILLFFDLQKEDGRLLDAVNPFIQVDWFTKPPIVGFFILKMMHDEEVFPLATLEYLYPRLIKLANYWEKNKGNTGLYFYRHPFDSGWDNATCFDRGMPVYAPDLNSYMVYLYLSLQQVALKLGYQIEAENFQNQANHILKNMVKHMFAEGEFHCLDAQEKPFKTTSLIKMMPLMLGKLLPAAVFEAMASEISKEDHFLLASSLATECVTSEYYDQRKGDINKPNAYWRGPVWAPPVFCIYEGLINAGYYKLGEKIALRFVDLVESDPSGIYENYDAIQKIGYDDSAYMWTVSVYLVLKDRLKTKVKL
jgi:putative isomerase